MKATEEELAQSSIGATIVEWDYAGCEIKLSNGVSIQYHPYETYIEKED